ncbi:hypothetical protein LXA43DRAFT_1067180 [Ganoderma leucocontextum]|nr:hypothetical protein LXA43DRAFT_1067180 [Ganoderma leucocontextum]
MNHEVLVFSKAYTMCEISPPKTVIKNAMPNPQKKPAPTETQIDEVRMWASELHYALAAKPTLDSPHCATWETHFWNTVTSIVDTLNIARFCSLPRTALRCIWENNCAFSREDEYINIEAVQPIVDGHLALTAPDGQRLKITADDDSPIGLLPEANIRDKWWIFQEPEQKEPRRRRGRAFKVASAPSVPSELNEPLEDIVHDGDGPRGWTTPRSSIKKSGQSKPRASSSRCPQDSLSPTPCENCQISGETCLFCLLVTSSCQACHKKKVKCTLTVVASKSLIVSYLGWAFWRMTACPDDYGGQLGLCAIS